MFIFTCKDLDITKVFIKKQRAIFDNSLFKDNGISKGIQYHGRSFVFKIIKIFAVLDIYQKRKIKTISVLGFSLNIEI